MHFPRSIIVVLLLCDLAQAYSSERLVINEFMATNIAFLLNQDSSDFVDWIELYNGGDSPVELGGLFLTDDLSNPFKWQLPGNAVIEPRSHFIIWADGSGIDNHASFKLSGKGEQIGLYDQAGNVLDTISFGRQPDDVSCGRYPDGGDQWQYFLNPTFSDPNAIAGFSSNAQAGRPVFSMAGGFFQGAQSITLTSGAGATVHYTLDGSIPTQASPVCTQPFNIDRTKVIRARAFHEDKLPSNIVTHTYLIDEPSTLPVISITTPPEFLFDESTGITTGICVSDELGAPPPFDPNANFWKRWERPVHLEYYTAGGDPGLRQDAGIAIFGGMFGRQIRQKSFTLYARDKYGDSDFDFPLFPTKSINSFRRFLLRCSSNDFNRTYIRDAMMNTLVVGQMDVDYQAYQPALVYINGNFWGLYNIREKMNQFYPESNYGIDPDRIDLIEGFDRTAHGDGSRYQELLQFVSNNDMSLAENYRYVQLQMDIVEYMNYFITEIYVCNRDWLHQNIKCWREHSDEGRWRWLLYDMDWGFSGEFWLGPDQFTDNTVRWVLDQVPDSQLFRGLIMNDEFKAEFAQRFVTHINLTFNPERVHQIISDMVMGIAPEMPRQIERWGAIQDMDYWNEQLDVLHNFAENRPFHMYVQLAETLLPAEKKELILEVSNGEAGYLTVYDVPAPSPLYAGQWYKDIPLNIRAHAKKGWRFLRWEGTFSSSDETITISLSDHAILHAVFEPYELPALVISEIHYNPSGEMQGEDEDFEFIELVNTEGSQMDVSGFRFTEGIDFTFPPGSFLEAGEYILVASNAGTYLNSGFQVFQLSAGKLDNAGEVLILADPRGRVIDQVHFDDHYPWPREPDGDGPSLELKDPSLDNNLASSWKASEKEGGSPGKGNITSLGSIQEPVPGYEILSIRPNPFGISTSVTYSVPEESRITLRIFNVYGQEICLLTNKIQKPGIYEIGWIPANLPDGIYYIHLSNGRTSRTEKVLYLGL